MALDINQSWNDASSKISSYKTVKETKDNEKTLLKSNSKSSKEKNSTLTKKQLSDSKESNKEKIKQIKSEVKNQLELLLDLFKESLPQVGNSNSLSTVTNYFLLAAVETKNQIGELLVNEMISTIGCSEEQSYENQPIYIKVKQIDLFSLLKSSPDDETAKVFYENETTSNGSFPYSMNKQLYSRLQTPNQAFSLDTTGGNGQTYVAASNSEIFDIEYVQNYLDPSGTLVTGDFYKVTLNSQANNRNTVSDFLRDYYSSIDILNLDVLMANIKNMLTGSFDAGLELSSDELTDQSNFMLILKRIMGICSDPSKKVDVSGTAKLSDVDNIDESFFEPTRQEEILSENNSNRIKKGVVEFEDCGNVEFPMNLRAELLNQQDIVNETRTSKKVELFNKYIDDISNDPNWKNLSNTFGLGLPNLNLTIKSSLQTSIITKIPTVIFKTILSPKVLLGFFIMLKSIKNEIGQNIDNAFDDLKGFLKTFKKFVLEFLRKVYALFVEKLFEIVKKNIKSLVESILLEIIRESKLKQVRMYSTIIYILFIVGQAVVDYRNCKSVIDEILKLLNLGLSAANIGLSPFILASASFLSGISDTRAISNTIENLQKAGLPTGAAPDGGPNLMNIAMGSMIKGMNRESAENGKTQIFIPPLTVTPAGITLPTIGNGKSY
jgi:hypothetical protein